jgi:uncharacterized protein YdaU (DUF1376 family)
MKAPAFQFYAADWLSSQRVALMTLEEEGAYIRLLAFCWQHGSIPAEPEKIARLIGKGASTTLATTLATMFELGGNGLVHERLEAERLKQELWKTKSSEGGKKSAESRKQKREAKTSAAKEQPPIEGCLPDGDNQKATLQSSSSSSSSNIPLLFPQEGDDITKGNFLPRGWKDLTKEQRKRIRVNANSPAMETIGKFFGRKPGTLWTVAEGAALFELKPTPDEVEILGRYYAIELEEDYRRRDLATLLNNWQTEIDRARTHYASTKT